MEKNISKIKNEKTSKPKIKTPKIWHLIYPHSIMEGKGKEERPN